MTTEPTPHDPDLPLLIISVTPTHPQGYGGHEFEYQRESDLFQCWKCWGYEAVLRDPVTGVISQCPGPKVAPEGTPA